MYMYVCIVVALLASTSTVSMRLYISTRRPEHRGIQALVNKGFTAYYDNIRVSDTCVQYQHSTIDIYRSLFIEIIVSMHCFILSLFLCCVCSFVVLLCIYIHIVDN